MSFPSFYDPKQVGKLYVPNTSAAMQAGNAIGVRASSEDTTRTVLLLIDEQVDFIHEDGALSVPGAVDDTRRIIEWIFSNLDGITDIVASLDSHVPIQIFSPAWWVDADGNHPSPYTVVTSEEVHQGKWQPLYEVDWSKEYVERLEENAKKQLMIWPYHTLIGTPGHTITPALYEAIVYHSAARQSQPNMVIKGTIPKTEHYSIFEPEVKSDDLQGGGLNRDLLEDLASYDRIYVTGQAKSHCVLESVTSMMRYFEDRPEVIQKIHLIEDATSSVVSPGIDFEALAVEAYDQFAEHGLQRTKTSQPV
ncbi:MAG: cysteine hydrolase family protein [Anaerolineae bacterium]|nr:cysteine hydrolase family protein [Anaerolineae bacterium]